MAYFDTFTQTGMVQLILLALFSFKFDSTKKGNPAIVLFYMP